MINKEWYDKGLWLPPVTKKIILLSKQIMKKQQTYIYTLEQMIMFMANKKVTIKIGLWYKALETSK